MLKVNYNCKGKPVTAAQQREDLASRIATLEAQVAESENQGVINALDKKLNELEDRANALRGKHDDQIVDRMACGFNLNEIINGIPEDGEDYTITCPACGCESRIMRTPPESVSDGA